jgi:hypothetical protein
VAYLYLHLLNIPVRPADSAYRTSFNPEIVLENARKYPLWLARIFCCSGDMQGQFPVHDQLLNNLAGIALTLIAGTGLVRCLGSNPTLRIPVVICFAWTGVFSSLPILAGGYGYHLNLALVGYAGLVGIGTVHALHRIPWLGARWAIGTVGVIGVVVLAQLNLDEYLENGLHSLHHRLNYYALNLPPVDPEVMEHQSLIFIEDRMQLGPWGYGGGNNLFKFVYLDPTLKERSVPAIDRVPMNQRLEWFRAKKSYFFRYDEEGRWYDDSERFAQGSAELLAARTSQLLSEGAPEKVIDLVAPVADRVRFNALIQYHYGFALQSQGQLSEALERYQAAIERGPPLFFAYWNRAMVLAELQRGSEGCSDLRRAESIDKQYPDLAPNLARLCGTAGG